MIAIRIFLFKISFRETNLHSVFDENYPLPPFGRMYIRMSITLVIQQKQFSISKCFCTIR